MNWTFSEFKESYRYGTLIVLVKQLKDGRSVCRRMRRKKNIYLIAEQMICKLPTEYSNFMLELGDVVFISQDKTCSILRDETLKPMFHITETGQIQKNTTLFKEPKC
jgi:hypothetical protein